MRIRVLSVLLGWVFVAASQYKTNVLLVMFDDLRPLLPAYGETHMITPHIDALAKKSVIFDHAYCQVAVCNPSRNSIMTGLSPDTTKSYAFLNSWWPHLSIPQHFSLLDYNLASFGKLYHWDDFDDPLQVGYGITESDWYTYQNVEGGRLNSTVNPDRYTPEEDFRDYIYTSKAISGLEKLAAAEKYFFLGLGFKLPHVSLHFPHKYYDMYRSRSTVWSSRAHARSLQYPPTSPAISYRCCAGDEFLYMNNEGASPSIESVNDLKSLSRPIPTRMHVELMWSYSAAISFLDAQVGRVMEAITALDLWGNLTVVLTSDHGMHNGEKGIWEKWTLFDESARVPLMVYHPESPFKGKHYQGPVELVDIYPTLLDMAGESQRFDASCPTINGVKVVCRPLDGQSLASVVLGHGWKNSNSNAEMRTMGRAHRKFAITQSLRCAKKKDLRASRDQSISKEQRGRIAAKMWESCSDEDSHNEVSLMGYSMRSESFRYTAYVPFNRTLKMANVSVAPVVEELYDHRYDSSVPLIDRELVNLAHSESYRHIARDMYSDLQKHLSQSKKKVFLH